MTEKLIRDGSRNPFVNQVFGFIVTPEADYVFTLTSRNPFVNQVFGFPSRRKTKRSLPNSVAIPS